MYLHKIWSLLFRFVLEIFRMILSWFPLLIIHQFPQARIQHFSFGLGGDRKATCDLCFTLRNVLYKIGARGSVVVKALRYKPAGRGFDSRWCHWNFSVALWPWGRLTL
jgi:hypothetical protein